MKKLILLVMLLSGIAKAQTFDFSCAVETIAGQWLPAWERQTRSFDQSRALYSVNDGSFVVTETRIHEIELQSTFYSFEGRINRSCCRFENNFRLFIDKKVTNNFISNLTNDVKTIYRLIDIGRVNGYVVENRSILAEHWAPASKNQIENFEQSRRFWDQGVLPIINSTEDNSGVAIQTRTLYSHIVKSQFFNYGDPTTGFIRHGYVHSPYPDAPPISSGAHLDFWVRGPGGTVEIQQSFELTIGRDINDDGDMLDLVERNIIRHQDGTFNEPVGTLYYRVYENRD